MEDLTFTCPVCGADVPRRAKACPECGACEKSGWSEDRYLDGLDLPDDNFGTRNYALLESGRGAKKSGRQRFWLVVAIIVVIAMVLLTLRGLW